MAEWYYRWKVDSHVGEVQGEMEKAIAQALQAVGVGVVGMTVDQMEHGYHDIHLDQYGNPHTAIRQWGDLQRDVNAEVHADEKAVYIGNSMPYATFVHEGTSKLKGRRYLVDTVMKNRARIGAIIKSYFSR